MGTIGGTLAHGDPASDLPAILLAARGLGDRSAASDGEREVAAADFFEDYLTTAVGEGEILTAVRFPKLSGYGYGYEKFNRRQEDWAMVAVSALVKKGGDGTMRGRARRADPHGLGAAAGDRGRGGAARAAADAESIAAAAEQAAEGTEPPADLNASQDYKRHLARVLMQARADDRVTMS